MRLPAAVENAAARFDRMTLRERALLAVAALAVVVMGWTVSLWDPIAARHSSLLGELTSLQEQMTNGAQAMTDAELADPANAALAKEEQLRKQLADINARLASKSGGLIPPERMVRVIQDVLARQRGVTLISLHNKPVTTLTPPDAKQTDASVPTTQSEQAEFEAANTGPFVHPVELVVEGRYLDILAYLHALEALEWRFYWKLLELETLHYPTNRVRIELNTLSMDRDWIGV
jgi:MSHA biogenesis protein MshJ